MTTLAQEPQVPPRSGVSLEEVDRLKQENEALRARLFGLSAATLLITENLDLDAVLQGIIDGARKLTDARYGALLVLDHRGEIEGFITSGIIPEQIATIKSEPRVEGLLQYLNEVEGPLRIRDIAGHPRSIGFPKNHPPMKSFLGCPVFHSGERLGNIYLTEKDGGREFTTEDEETITMFATHAATAITNARRHREETRSRADLRAMNERFVRLCDAMRSLSESLDVDNVLNGM